MKNRKTVVTALLLTVSTLFSACSYGRKNNSKIANSKDKYGHLKDNEDEKDHDREYPDWDGVPDYLNGQKTWFEKQGLEYTPCGNFDMYMLSQSSVIQVPAYIEIQTNFECEPGRKNIVATTIIAIGQRDGWFFWTSSFDKYSGTSFEFQNGSNTLYDGCNITNSGDVWVVIGDYEYTFHIIENITMEDDVTTLKYTINCPLEYDGAVLQYGYCPQEEIHDHDFSEKAIWYADDFTDMHGYYDYFTLEGTPTRYI